MYVVQVRVEAVDRDGKAIVRRSIPVPLKPSKGRFKNATVLDLKRSIRGIMGVPVGDQELSGPLPFEDRLDDDVNLAERGIVPGVQAARAHSEVNPGELFTTTNVSAARARLRLSSETFSSSDVFLLRTKHPLREYILADGFYYQRIKNPCFRMLARLLGLALVSATAAALALWLWNVGKLALPKPKVWLNFEKKIIKFIMLQELDEDIPQEIRERLEKLEL